MSKGLLGTRAKLGGAEAKRLDLIMAANVQTALATKVQELSGVFRKKQTAYLRRTFLLYPWSGRELTREL
jgi:syntaxin 16